MSSAAASSAAAMDVTFFDNQGDASNVAGAVAARVAPVAFQVHPLFATYQNIAKNAYEGLAKATKRAAEVAESKVGSLHSLEIKFECKIPKEDLSAINQQIHTKLFDVALAIPVGKADFFRQKLAGLPNQFSAEMKLTFFNAAKGDNPRSDVTLDNYDPPAEVARVINDNTVALSNYISILKVKASTPTTTNQKRKRNPLGSDVHMQEASSLEKEERKKFAFIKPRGPPKKKQKNNPPQKRRADNSAGGKRKPANTGKKNKKTSAPLKSKRGKGKRSRNTGPLPSTNLPKGQQKGKGGLTKKKN
ncbi:hypothetical protein Glove_543g132 [Diversispora epigaea]|uniref:Uncharacterized protein n=1 Tax=Diversispora epigaea TaxID=1348612 RepID=A0A397GCI1_9GLOM|nr:hypothetical protein Glove_543g132 [Diversispora epigaea]